MSWGSPASSGCARGASTTTATTASAFRCPPPNQASICQMNGIAAARRGPSVPTLARIAGITRTERASAWYRACSVPVRGTAHARQHTCSFMRMLMHMSIASTQPPASAISELAARRPGGPQKSARPQRPHARIVRREHAHGGGQCMHCRFLGRAHASPVPMHISVLHLLKGAPEMPTQATAGGPAAESELEELGGPHNSIHYPTQSGDAHRTERASQLPHRWSSGRILPCHGRDPGSIPGRCTV